MQPRGIRVDPPVRRDATPGYIKLFRRLTEFFTEPQSGLADFLAWLAKTEEQELDLVEHNFTHFDNLVEITGGKVRLMRRPEQIVFVSAKTASPLVAPWLEV